MSKRFTITINEDEYGEIYLQLTDDICEDLGWRVGDTLEYDLDDIGESFTLKKVTDECLGF